MSTPGGETGRSSSRDKTVMLLLDMDQTQRITVATQSGFISLPLCNPEDTWAAVDVSEPEPAPEGPQTDSEPSEEWEVWTINGEESERSTFVKEGEVWRPRESPE